MVTSLDATHWFCESGLVILANQHGCGVRISRPVEVNTALLLEGLPGEKMVSARVVNCISLGEYERFWLLGMELRDPGNVWGIETPPDDWLDENYRDSFIDRMLHRLTPKKKTESAVFH
jgi:hypothetical protein